MACLDKSIWKEGFGFQCKVCGIRSHLLPEGKCEIPCLASYSDPT